MKDWVNTFQGVVIASEYDATSFMNSQMYASRFDQATWLLLQAIGVTPSSIREEALRVAVIRQNFQFLRELRGGELVRVRSGFLTIGEKYFRILHQMFDEDSEVMVATCDIVAVRASRDTNQSVKLPENLRERAKAHLVTKNVPDAGLPTS